MSTLYNFIKAVSKKLAPLYHNSIQQEQVIWWMLEAITQKSRAQLITSDFAINDAAKKKLDEWIMKHVEEKMPLQYLIGSVPFAHCTLFVEPPILIPRPETEEWICALIEQLQLLENKALRILDLCTGSGALAIALAHALPKASITATDINPKALELACKNALHNGVHVTFIESDLFTALHNQKFDIIITNPPYVSHEEWLKLDPMVRDWEDYHALVASNNGTELIEKIIEQAPNFLTGISTLSQHGVGQLYVEIGHTHGEVVRTFMEKQFSKALVIKDYATNDRVVIGF